MQSTTPKHGRYIGDGVYAEFDGYQVWVYTLDPYSRPIALEPQVLHKLMEFYEEVRPK